MKVDADKFFVAGTWVFVTCMAKVLAFGKVLINHTGYIKSAGKLPGAHHVLIPIHFSHMLCQV